MTGFRFHGDTVGDCFEVAVDLVYLDQLELGDRDEVRVVHGLPVGRGPANEGRRYWHAWVEVTRRARLPEDLCRAHPELLQLLSETGELETVVVVDRSNGLDLTLPRAAYYALGGLGEGTVWRFTPEQARHELLVRGHYGPWIDSWKDLEEVWQVNDPVSEVLRCEREHRLETWPHVRRCEGEATEVVHLRSPADTELHVCALCALDAAEGKFEDVVLEGDEEE